MNYRKGGMRLLIAVTALWSAFWGWTYYDASSTADGLDTVYSEEFRQLRELWSGPSNTAENRAYFDRQLLELRELRDEQIARRDHALLYGFGGLVALLLAILIGTWAWRGLKAP